MSDDPFIGDVSGMDPESEFAQRSAAGAEVQMRIVRPAECALFVVVNMDGTADVQAVGVSRKVAGGILRMLGRELDPEGDGGAEVKVRHRPVEPITRPDGSPL